MAISPYRSVLSRQVNGSGSRPNEFIVEYRIFSKSTKTATSDPPPCDCCAEPPPLIFAFGSTIVYSSKSSLQDVTRGNRWFGKRWYKTRAIHGSSLLLSVSERIPNQLHQ